MYEKPPPPQWGVLITRARKAQDLTIADCARAVGLSATRWAQLMAGCQAIGGGAYVHARGKDSTWADIAALLGVTPAELAEAGRGEAAVILARMSRPRQRRPETISASDLVATIRAMTPDQARDALVSIVRQLADIAYGPEQDEDEQKYGT